jgi:hypothetical protein
MENRTVPLTQFVNCVGDVTNSVQCLASRLRSVGRMEHKAKRNWPVSEPLGTPAWHAISGLPNYRGQCENFHLV